MDKAYQVVKLFIDVVGSWIVMTSCMKAERHGTVTLTINLAVKITPGLIPILLSICLYVLFLWNWMRCSIKALFFARGIGMVIQQFH